MKVSMPLKALVGLGALWLLAMIVPGLHVQAATLSPLGLCPAALPALPVLNDGFVPAGPTFDMDDNDGDEGHFVVVGTSHAPIVAVPPASVAEPNHPARETWSPGSAEAPQVRPEEGCTLRRRIFKKTR